MQDQLITWLEPLLSLIVAVGGFYMVDVFVKTLSARGRLQWLVQRPFVRSVVTALIAIVVTMIITHTLRSYLPQTTVDPTVEALYGFLILGGAGIWVLANRPKLMRGLSQTTSTDERAPMAVGADSLLNNIVTMFGLTLMVLGVLLFLARAL